MIANEKIGEMIPDNLIYDTLHPVDVKGIQLASGQGVLKRGSVIAVSEEGAKLWNGDNGTADCILADDVDTGTDTGTTVFATAYRSGHFNRNALIVADDAELSAQAETELRNGGIYLSNAMSM